MYPLYGNKCVPYPTAQWIPGGTSELDPDIGLSPSQVGRLVAG